MVKKESFTITLSTILYNNTVTSNDNSKVSWYGTILLLFA